VLLAIMQFKKFTLDPFQENAIQNIEKHHSVIVSAATGTGKTIIADYIIDKYLKVSNKKVIYTSPIKALSNQKYKDFKHDYGLENIGILTGDIVINSNAPILIMTTEIYRNMLLGQDTLLDDVEYVIFDEIHYMSDPERGTVWEESIIFSPSHIRFLCLSATIPNSKELASWIQTIKDHQVDVVHYSKRAVPLKHFVFETYVGLTAAKDLAGKIPKYRHQTKKYYSKRNKKRGKKYYQVASPNDVISKMRKKLPTIIFSFSRKECISEALKLSRNKDFLDSIDKKNHIIKTWRKHFTPQINRIDTTNKLRKVLLKGIGFHHAGLIPQHKAVVEELFSQGLLKVLFTTETFSVGINMPAKMVIFNGLRKFDGRNFRLINSREYFQLAGRAGRRGIDDVGYVVVIIDREKNDINDLVRISSGVSEPIHGQFKLSYNTVLNLIANHDEDEIEKILKSNFEYYLRRKKSTQQLRIKISYNHKYRYLQKMLYISTNGELTEKGQFARHIYFQELLISELFLSDLYKKLSDIEILQVIAGIIYEQRKNDHFSFHDIQHKYNELLRKLQSNPFIIKNLNKLSLKRMLALVGTWGEGSDFEVLLSLTMIGEGDIIRLFRRVIDMIGQIRNATRDYDLKERLLRCQKKIDRGLVAVEL